MIAAVRAAWWYVRRWWSGTDLLVPEAFRHFDRVRQEWTRAHGKRPGTGD